MNDMEYLTKSMLSIRSKDALLAFTQEMGTDRFNSALNRLSGDDFAKVTGRMESIRIDALVAGQAGHPNIGNMLRTAADKAEARISKMG